MIQVQDTTAAIREQKTHRKDLRLKPSVMAQIERAALNVGMDSSTFITSVSYRAAQEIDKAQHKTILSNDTFNAFAAAIDNEVEGSEALTSLFEKRKELLIDG